MVYDQHFQPVQYTIWYTTTDIYIYRLYVMVEKCFQTEHLFEFISSSFFFFFDRTFALGLKGWSNINEKNFRMHINRNGFISQLPHGSDMLMYTNLTLNTIHSIQHTKYNTVFTIPVLFNAGSVHISIYTYIWIIMKVHETIANYGKPLV